MSAKTAWKIAKDLGMNWKKTRLSNHIMIFDPFLQRSHTVTTRVKKGARNNACGHLVKFLRQAIRARERGTSSTL